MAITWGAAKGSPNKFRTGIDLKIPVPTVSDSSVTVTVEYWIWTKDALSDGAITLTKSGNATNPGTSSVSATTPSNSDWSTRNKVMVRSETKVIAVTDEDQTLQVSADLRGVNEAGTATIARHSVSGVLKRSPLAVPDTPTGAVASRNSDTSHTLTWANTNPTTASKRYAGLNVYRRDNVATSWALIKELAGIVTSFTDTTTRADRQYTYAVRARNAAGLSPGQATSPAIETNPAPPIEIDARRIGSNVVLSWKNVSTIADTYTILHATDGIEDGSPLDIEIDAAATTYTHAGAVVDVSHTYWIVPVGERTGPRSAASPVVPTAARPLPADGLTPNGVVLASADPILLSWDHGDDGGEGAQVARSVRLRAQPAVAGDPSGPWIYLTSRSLAGSGSASSDTLTISGHMLNTGGLVRFTDGTPPAPLSLGVDYYAIPVTASSLRVALSEEDAEDGIYVDLSDDGAGFTTFNPVALSNSQQLIIAGGTLTPGAAYEWTVATRGIYAGTNPLSDWAPVAAFRAGSIPTLTWNYPEDGDTTDSPQVLAAWGFYSPDEGVTQAWWQVALYRGDTLVEIAESADDWGEYLFEAPLVNGVEYRIEGIVEGSNGIRSEVASTSFTPEYVGPLAPGVSLYWDVDEGEVEIEITNTPDDDKPDAITNTVEHSLPGGRWTVIATNVPTGTTLVHYLPYPNQLNQYRITGIAADKSRADHVVAIDCTNSGDWYWLNGGSGYSVKAKARYFGGASQTLSLDKELHAFAGRSRPVEYTGSLVTNEIEVSATFPRDDEGYAARAEFKTLVETAGPIYYRDPAGLRMKCSLREVSFNESGHLIDFSAKLTEVA